MKNSLLLTAAALLCAIASPMTGAAPMVVNIDTAHQGIFTSFGQNNKGFNSGAGNYLCGLSFSVARRAYFLFSLPPNLVGPGQQVVAATLRAKMTWCGYDSVDPSETFTLFDVGAASYDALFAENTSIFGRTDVYADLGTGNVFGHRVVTPADEATINELYKDLLIPLTEPAFFSELESRLAQGSIGIGGSITTIAGTGNQYLFCSSSYETTGRVVLSLTIDGGACAGDINSDGLVDDADFSIFAPAYDILDCADPGMPMGCPADLNADGFVNDADFSIFAVAYDTLLCP